MNFPILRQNIPVRLCGEILVATSNRHKLEEISRILKHVTLKSVTCNVKEDGRTFEANAVKKAKAAAKKFNQIALADDSGLMVDCLGGKPGVKSARFASPPTAENLCRKLLKVMSNESCVTRRAEFVCVIAIASPSGKVRTVKGICHGKIIREMRGEHGFGYDPVFVPDGYKKTFAEMKPVFKNRISHRRRALQKLKSFL